VVAIVPITIMMPAVLMFIPPLVALSPTPLASCAQLVTPVIRLAAVRPVVLDSFMELALGTHGTPGAIVWVGGGTGRTRKQERETQRDCRQRFSCDKS
jgi:hypothetical protein